MTLTRSARMSAPRKPLAQFSAKRLAELAAQGIDHPASTFMPKAKTPKLAVPRSLKLPARPAVAKPTGEFSPAVVELIIERDGHSCTRCGIGVGDQRGLDYSIQHRRARGNGGSSLPGTGGAANGVILCGSATSPHCHHAVEQRDPQDEIDGYWIQQLTGGKPTDPATVPIKHALYEGFILLGNDGSIERIARVAA